MAISKARTGHSVPKKRVQAAGQTNTPQKPVALTLKVDSKTYVRLSMLGATQRRTHQDIMREAVEQYLDRAKA
jgi:hypothetical protein